VEEVVAVAEEENQRTVKIAFENLPIIVKHIIRSKK
jgi:hypothetical protein